jgi:pimeloyl-ACP methyl ester carboxylesterase
MTLAQVGEISVRTLPAGGAVAGSVYIEAGSISPYGRRQLVILVHGYANSKDAASSSFQACIDNLQNLPGPASISLPSPIFKFYWPGDTQIRIFSEISYPTEIGPATESGQRLAEFLETLVGPNGTPTEVHLVAHSLGNRVALEMLKAFNVPQSSVVFRTISMMAAAIPVPMVSDGASLCDTWRIVQRSQVLCSVSDWVLHWAFPIGETAAFEGFFPEAVGRFGDPAGNWDKILPLNDYSHGSYWPNILTAPFLASFMEMPVNPPLLARAVLGHRIAPTRRIRPSQTMPSRKIKARDIG